ncbi:hypothetical protein [Metabacillus endolithicus]|uniref:hypothetical protein n=1 Tax=Metabacillus endolithicus TaxID=1535204 RepID=UPI00366DC6F8
MRLKKVNEHEVNLIGIKRNLINDEMLFEAQTQFDDLKMNLVKVSKSVIGYAKLKGWEDNELVNLHNEIKSLFK